MTTVRQGWWAFVGLLLIAAADADAQSAAPHDRYRAVRVAEFGDADGEGAFSNAFGVAVSARGRVYVSEPGKGRILEFDSRGGFLRVVSLGQGPGDLQVPGALLWRGDSLAVSDFRNGISLFDANGVLRGRINFVIAVPGSPFGGRPVLPLADGNVAVVVTASPTATTVGEPGHEVWLKASRSGAVVDTITALPMRGRSIALSAGGTSHSFSHPLGWAPLVAAPPDATSVVIVEREPASSSEVTTFRVVRLNLDGDPVGERAIEYAPRAVTRGLVDSLVSSLAAQVSGRTGLPVGSLLPLIKGQVQWPSYEPPVSRALAGVDGSVWLERGREGIRDVRWDILDENLAAVGEIHLPLGLDVKVVSRDAVWAVERRSPTVARVVKLAVRKTGPGSP